MSLSWRYLLKDTINVHCPGSIYLRTSSIFIVLDVFTEGNHRFSLSWRHFLKEIIDLHCPGRIYLRKSLIFIALQKHALFFIDTVDLGHLGCFPGDRVGRLESRGPGDINIG